MFYTLAEHRMSEETKHILYATIRYLPVTTYHLAALSLEGPVQLQKKKEPWLELPTMDPEDGCTGLLTDLCLTSFID